MIIGWDVDGVLANTVDKILAYRNRIYGTSYRREQVISHDMHKLWGGTVNEAIEFFHRYYDSPEYRTTQPVEGSVEAVRELTSRGHEHKAVSARPLVIAQSTEDFIREHYGEKTFEKIVLTNQWSTGNSGARMTKADVCRAEGVDVLVEDFVGYAEECAQAGVQTFLLDCPWNQSERLHSGVQRVKHLREVVEALSRKL